ncbi:MAG: hypothetical protein KA314_06770, partial [Chloroflexi bacterium]|nr:hypothetical protein [Chloroflexota bacterium]
NEPIPLVIPPSGKGEPYLRAKWGVTHPILPAWENSPPLGAGVGVGEKRLAHQNEPIPLVIPPSGKGEPNLWAKWGVTHPILPAWDNSPLLGAGAGVGETPRRQSPY